MAWRYVNPGYACLLAVPTNATETTVAELSNTGVGFYYTDSTTGIALASVDSSITDLWIKFEVYLPDNATNYTVTVFFPGNRACGFRFRKYRDNDYDVYAIMNNSAYDLKNTSLPDEFGIMEGAVNSVWIHYKYGNLLEAKINHFYYSLTRSVYSYYSSEYPKILRLFSNSANVVFSGVIISDEEISPKEKVVALPVNTTETAMTAQEGGIYLADNVGQTLLQTIDASALISQYGSDSKITGIALVGNPAYRTGEQLSSLTAISKSGGVTTEHGTSNLSDASDTVILQGFSVASDTTIADLQNMQLGWKAGE